MSSKAQPRTTKQAARRAAAVPLSTGQLSTNDRFDLANRVFFRLYQSSNLMHRTGTRAVSAHGATTQQWAVMGALSRPRKIEVGMSVKELMAFLAVSRQSLTIVLNRLEGLDLVERVRVDGDGRVRRIRLTETGCKTWARMLGDIKLFYKDALSDFSDEETEALFKLLDRLTRGLASQTQR